MVADELMKKSAADAEAPENFFREGARLRAATTTNIIHILRREGEGQRTS